MSELECKNCKHYKGNCGHHHVDSLTGHINYEIPAERMYVNKFDPSCYEWKGDELEMTIDEAKKIIHDFLNNPYGVPVCGLDDAIKIALSIMEKYQKIMEFGKEKKEAEFHCGVEESGGHAYNCGDCPNKCDVYYQWDKEIEDGNDPR